MESVATSNVIAFDLVLYVIISVSHARPVSFDVSDARVECLVDDRSTRRFASLHQIAGDFCLSINHHGLAGKRFKVDAVANAAEGNFGSIMDQAFLPHARPAAGLLEKSDSALLQDPGTNAAEHVLLRPLLENDRVNARPVEQLTQKKSGRTGADDCNLCSCGFHVFLHWVWLSGAFRRRRTRSRSRLAGGYQSDRRSCRLALRARRGESSGVRRVRSGSGPNRRHWLLSRRRNTSAYSGRRLFHARRSRN